MNHVDGHAPDLHVTAAMQLQGRIGRIGGFQAQLDQLVTRLDAEQAIAARAAAVAARRGRRRFLAPPPCRLLDARARPCELGGVRLAERPA